MSQYIVANFDRKEYLRPEAFGEVPSLEGVVKSYDGVLGAMSILLADGNNRGSGDLRSDAEIIGSWAGNRIAIIDSTVTSREFGEPGMENVPLQQQLLTLGRDVSGEVYAVIRKAEGEYWSCYHLNSRHTLPLVAQRELDSNAAKRLLTADGRKMKLETLDELYGIFAVPMGITPYGAARQLQKGLDKMATSFGVSNDLEVLSAHYELGTKPMAVSDYSDEKRPVEGVVAVHFALKSRTGGETRTEVIRLGTKGDSTEAVYARLLPQVRFEKEPQLTDGITSPEVARLLANLKLDNNSKEA